MIIANVSRSRRSCRSSLTTIEPSLRRLMRPSPRPCGLLRGRDEHVLEVRRGRLDGGRRRRRSARRASTRLSSSASFAASTRSDVPICASAMTPGRSRSACCARRGSGVSTSSVRPGKLGHQLVRRAVGDDAAAVEDREPRAALGFVHVVRRDEQRRALIRELEQRVPELAARLRIDGAGRLVEEQQIRLVQHRAREREALLLAAGQRAGELLALLAQPEALDAARRCAARAFARGMSCTAARNARFSSTVRSSYSENFCVM